MYTSLMLNHYISGDNPWSYHLFNILVNSLVVLLGVLLAKKGYNGSKAAGWMVGVCALAAGLTKETGFF